MPDAFSLTDVGVFVAAAMSVGALYWRVGAVETRVKDALSNGLSSKVSKLTIEVATLSQRVSDFPCNSGRCEINREN